MSNTIEEAVVKALESKNIPPGKVRPIDKNILRLYMMGAKHEEIAKELGISKIVVNTALRNPAVKQELERLDILTDKELIKLTSASKRRMLEASLDAADHLIEFMDGETTDGLKLKAIIKVLEYAHGKPRQSVVITPGVEKPLSDGDESIIDEMIANGVEKDEGVGD